MAASKAVRHEMVIGIRRYLYKRSTKNASREETVWRENVDEMASDRRRGDMVANM